MILGFTGTRRQPSNPQIEWLRGVLSAMWARQEVSELHHGCCIGADAFAHMLSYRTRIPIVVHPPLNKKLAYLAALGPHHLPLVTVLPAAPYMVRNRAIVDACDRLIALPDGPPRPHSGTWGTIDYAEGNTQLHTANRVIVPVTICWPDGKIETR
jgi:hypothetical protein